MNGLIYFGTGLFAGFILGHFIFKRTKVKVEEKVIEKEVRVPVEDPGESEFEKWNRIMYQ